MPRSATFVALALVSLPIFAMGQHTATSANSQREVRANGRVKSAHVLGGNPVAADAAVTAVGTMEI